MGGITTARKSPIGLANHQWGMKKTPTDGASLYQTSLNFFVVKMVIFNYEG